MENERRQLSSKFSTCRLNNRKEKNGKVQNI